MIGDIVAMVGAALLSVPGFGALYARPGRADGRVAAGIGVLALLTVAASIAVDHFWPEPIVGFQLVIFSRADLALMYAGVGSSVVGAAVIVLGMFGVVPPGSYGRRLLAAWILLALPVIAAAFWIGAGLLWFGVLPTLALGLVTLLAPKEPSA